MGFPPPPTGQRAAPPSRGLASPGARSAGAPGPTARRATAVRRPSRRVSPSMGGPGPEPLPGGGPGPSRVPWAGTRGCGQRGRKQGRVGRRDKKVLWAHTYTCTRVHVLTQCTRLHVQACTRTPFPPHLLLSPTGPPQPPSPWAGHLQLGAWHCLGGGSTSEGPWTALRAEPSRRPGHLTGDPKWCLVGHGTERRPHPRRDSPASPDPGS